MTKQVDERRAQVLQRHEISQKAFEETGLKWTDLEAIADDHRNRSATLLSVGEFVADCVRRVPGVHSVKSRVKDPEHLMVKIIRKKIKEPARTIDADNYRKEVTDLIGVRALHLFKYQWESIHKMVSSEFTFDEKPVAYFRRGDDEEALGRFQEAGCTTEEHPAGYRSIHYVISSMPQKDTHHVEIQVRTIFEEGWAEIDHLVRYPRKRGDKVLDQFLGMFNSSASYADAMGTFLITLQAQLEEQRRQKRQAEATKAQLDRTIEKLKISEGDKEDLKLQVTAAQTASYALGTSTTISDMINPYLQITPTGIVLQTNPYLTQLRCPNGHVVLAGEGVPDPRTAGLLCPTCRASLDLAAD